MKSIVPACIAVFGCLMLCSCSTAPESAAIPKTVTLTESNNGASVALSKDSTLVVSLASNPTTGYRWIPSPQQLLSAPAEAEYVQRAGSVGLCGAGGTESWTFRPLDKGTEVLKFQYARPWEKPLQPVNTVSYTIIVE